MVTCHSHHKMNHDNAAGDFIVVSQTCKLESALSVETLNHTVHCTHICDCMVCNVAPLDIFHLFECSKA